MKHISRTSLYSAYRLFYPGIYFQFIASLPEKATGRRIFRCWAPATREIYFEGRYYKIGRVYNFSESGHRRACRWRAPC